MDINEIIESIGNIYGYKLVIVALLFVFFEIVFFVFLKKNKCFYTLKIVVILIAFILGFWLFLRARTEFDRDKLFCRGYQCSLQKVVERMSEDSNEELISELLPIYQAHYLKKYGKYDDLVKGYDFSVVCDESIKHIVNQSMICFVVLLIGYVFSKSVYKDSGTLMAGFSAAPMGVGLVVLYYVGHILLEVPITKVKLIVCALFLIIGCTYWNCKKGFCSIKRDVMCLGFMLCGSIFSSLAKWFKFGGDCEVQLKYATIFLKEGKLGENFTTASTFGFLGTALHGIALVIGEDYFYSIFLILSLSMIGLSIASLKYFVDKNNVLYAMLLITISYSMLLLNYDFGYYSVWILSNAPIAGYLCLIVVSTFISAKSDIDMSWIIAISSLVIMVTRVEGVCYVILFSFIPFVRNKYLSKANIILGAEIVLWEIAQEVFYSGDLGGESFDEKKGALFIATGIIMILLQMPKIRRINVFGIIEKNYFYIYIIALLVVIFFAFYLNYDFSIETSKILLSHLSVSRYSNSLAYFMFLLMLLPVVVANKSCDLKMGLCFILGYYMLIFGVALLRINNPFHIQVSDSFRRMIFQGMPLSTWIMSNLLLDNNIIIKGDEKNG